VSLSRVLGLFCVHFTPEKWRVSERFRLRKLNISEIGSYIVVSICSELFEGSCSSEPEEMSLGEGPADLGMLAGIAVKR
jgi:hypothetical protein